MATKKNNRKKPRKETAIKREIAGVGLIAFGLFLAVSLYSTAAGLLGGAISGFVYGLIGLAGYAAPALFVCAGVYLIAAPKARSSVRTVLSCCGGALLSLAIMQLYINPPQGNPFFTYLTGAYEYSERLRVGGGGMGALIAYPLTLLLGESGSYIFCIAGLVILFLIITKFSLRTAGEKVGETIKSGVTLASERREHKNSFYNENMLVDDEPPVIKKTKKGKRAQPQIIEEPNSAGWDEDIEFFPSSGMLKKRSLTVVRPENSAEVPDLFAEDDEYKDNSAPIAEEAAPVVPAAVTEPSAPDRPSRTQPPAPDPDDNVTPSSAPASIMEYQRPPFTLLNPAKALGAGAFESPAEKARILIETLASFNISAKIINVSVGPVITRYEIQPAQGVRVNRITNLSNDLALSLAAPRVRIEAPIPGKAAVGIEVPNKNIAMVLLREVIESKEFAASLSPVSFALGKDIAGKIITADLDRMPHLLIAGSTGSGKSVCINDIIISLAYKSAPSDVRLILIDPKVVELSVFSTLPHLLIPVVTDPKKAAGALKWAVLEMEQRYQKMAKLGVRNQAGYNALVSEEERLPKLVIVIDELADLMMVAAKDVEESICRIAQLGRACGIHLIVATQRPSADIITGLIKANIPSRIAFAVSSSIDSRVILDGTGAEKLLGRGDMLFHANGSAKPIRIQGAFVSDEEVERITQYFAQQATEPAYNEAILEEVPAVSASGAQGSGKQEDDLLPEAVKIVLDSGQASISMIQRRLRVGYARAARLVDIMEQKKIVSGFDGSKPRRVLIDRVEYERMFGSAAGQDPAQA